MKVGDLVRRNSEGFQRLGFGIVLSVHPGADLGHPWATIHYPRVRRTWDIAVSLIEVISEGR